MTCRISVIMAVYNTLPTLDEAVESVLKQTCQDFELIICDDCSTDGTYERVLTYEAAHPGKVRVIRNEKNSRLAYSLNHCLQFAKGEYIARMDGDDISVPERFEKQAAFLDAHPEYALVSTAMIPFDENGEGSKRTKKEIPTKYDLIHNPCFHHATIMMRKSAYDALGGYLVSPMTQRTQDYELWFRFFRAGFKGYNMQEALYLVREDAAAFSRRTLGVRLQAIKIRFKGYRTIGLPFYYYIFALKPLLGIFKPKSLK